MYKSLAKDTVHGIIETVLDHPYPRCPVCLDNIPEANITLCDHPLCKTCVQAMYILEGSNTRCPICRADLDPDKTERAELTYSVETATSNNYIWLIDTVRFGGLLLIVSGFPIYMFWFY